MKSLALLLLPIAALAQNNDLHLMKVQGNVYMLVGPGGNMAVQAGKDGLVVVDSKTADQAKKIVDLIQPLSPKPLKYIINTSADADHTGGNAELKSVGVPVVGGNLGASNRGAAIVAHEGVMNRLSAPTGQKSAAPEAAWPNVTYFQGQKEIFVNGEALEIKMVASAHTDGDSIVFFRRSDVIATGDIFYITHYPVINLEQGGNVEGILKGLNLVLDIAIPEHEQEGGTMIIPGHGRLCDEHDVLEYRDMVTIVRDRIASMIKKGMTIDQVKAAKPTMEYDGRYGAKTGPGTTEMFVEAVYKSLKK